MIARAICWLLGHDAVLVTGRSLWGCRRCRQVWPLLCLALLLSGCRHQASSTPDVGDELAELRALAEVARALVEEAAGLCPAASDPARCQAASEAISASLVDVDQLLAAAEACQGDDKATCQREASKAAGEAAPRLGLRVARLVVQLGRGGR